MPLQILLQSIQNWEPDWISIGLGVAAGIVLTLLAQRLWPVVRRLWQRLTGRVQRSVAWMRTSVESRYLTEVIAYARQYHLGWQWVDLDDVYVPPRLLAPMDDFDPFEQTGGDNFQLYQIWPHLASGIVSPSVPTATVDELLLNGQRTVIYGGPGSGKSSLLAYAAFRLASEAAAEPESPDEVVSPWLPVLLHLAELDLSLLDDPETVDPAEPIIVALQKRANPLISTGVRDLIRQKLKSKHLVLLLDGYDTAVTAERQAIAAWLEDLVAQQPALRLIVTTAPIGYGPLLNLGFVAVTLLPWRMGKATKLGINWQAAMSMREPRLTHYWRPGQSALTTTMRLWRTLFFRSSKPATGDLSPLRQHDLLTDMLPLFTIEARRRLVGLTPPEPVVLAFWQILAFTQLYDGMVSLPSEQVEALATEIARGDSASRLLRTLEENPLFRRWANDSVSLSSSVWRDYLAAGHLAAEEKQEVVETYLRDPRWTQAIRFYVAKTGATELVARLFNEKDPSPMRDALFQVAGWMPDAPDSGDWQRQTLILLGQLIRQSTFAEVLRLRAVVALAQTGETGVYRFMSQLLERSDPFMRRAGVIGLSALSPERALPLLEKMVVDDEPAVRETAVHAIAWLHHPATERPLIAALLSDNEQLSQAAAIGLARNGGDSLSILREALQEDKITTRRAAVLGLSLRDDDWVPDLLGETERLDAEWAVQSAANVALEAVGKRRQIMPWYPLNVSEQQWLQDYARDERRVVPEGAATMPFLVQILTESSWPNLRVAAARTLGQIPNLSALPALETAVRDDEPRVREAAFATLCQIRRAFS